MHRAVAVARLLLRGAGPAILAFALLVATGLSTPAVSPAQNGAQCKVLVSVGGGEHVLRPPEGGRYAFSGPEAPPLGGQRVLVHYTRTGIDKPPLADANGNGSPDYVEKVEAQAEAALDFDASPRFG